MELFSKGRFNLVLCTFILAIIFISGHLFMIQVINGRSYTSKAIQRETITVPLEDFTRGQILDRNLRSLTQSFVSNRVVVFPQVISKQKEVAEGLANVFHRDYKEVFSLLKTPGILPYEPSLYQTEVIKKRDWPGVLVAPVHFRYGPNPLAAQVVGYLGKIAPVDHLFSESIQWVGRTGLERFYDTELRTEQPMHYARLYIDARGVWLKGYGIEINFRNESSKSLNIVTTIDADVQLIAERTMDNWQIKNGAIVIMDARNGDLLAMASRPVYDPNPKEIGRYLDNEPGAFLDHCVGLYPPGSIFKVVVAAAALAEGIANPGTIFECRGENDKPVCCWFKQGHGVLSFQEAFIQSCNPVFVQLAMKLGAEKLVSYARLFGFDDQQIIGYPVPFDRRQNLDLITKPHSLVNSALGQGPVLATPVQITTMMNVIANEGKRFSPRLVRELREENGQVARIYNHQFNDCIISLDVARQLKEMLTGVTRDGIGKKAFLPVYGSAGKTGSAELGNGYIDAWFSGYAPLVNPKYVVTVLVAHGKSGSQSAAPVFKEVMERILELD